MRYVQGVGINDYDGAVLINGRAIDSYDKWKLMLRRCYNPKDLERYPSYKECCVDIRWLRFSEFKKWYDANYPHDVAEKFQIHMDKDLSGSKVYGPDTCRFIPAIVNTFMTNHQKSNTSGHPGVMWHKKAGKWAANISCKLHGAKYVKWLGQFNSKDDAIKAYNAAREEHAAELRKLMESLGYSTEVTERIR